MKLLKRFAKSVFIAGRRLIDEEASKSWGTWLGLDLAVSSTLALDAIHDGEW